jgi:outer membrane lipoprotein
MKTLPLALAALALAGCAAAPKPLQGDFAALLPVDASAAQRVGDTVRWGGTLVAVTPARDETCFEVLGRDLSDSARPRRADDTSSGRFLACRAGFYDPAIFAVDREVTVTGRVAGFETRRIGEYDYTYPRVAADVVYLWPERREDDYYYVDPFWPSYRPFWWGGGYYVPVRPHRAHPHPRSERGGNGKQEASPSSQSR